MKRKTSCLDEEESRLSSLLFNKSKRFAENLPNQLKNEVDIDYKPVWTDDDDELFGLNIIPGTKTNGLYVNKLKQKYETLVGTPTWAKIDNVKAENNNDSENDILLRTAGHLKKSKSKSLQKGILEIKNFPKVNKETGNEGSIISNVEFHPKMSVVLIAGNSGIVSLYSVGSDKYTKLHSFNLKKWKVSAAQFSPDGSEAYISSKFQHSYCVYNLVTSEPKFVQLPKIVKRPEIFQISPDGQFLATSDGFDQIYIICVVSKELLKSLKNSTNVNSVTFSHNSKQLLCYGVQGEVSMWDLTTFRVLKKFFDHGCVTASCITTSSCGSLIATGSGEGIVNIYEANNLTTNEPLPCKTITNLTTKITKLKFNTTTEILSVSSSYYPNAVKLVHIPSYNVFCNFPQKDVHQVETVSFSPNSGYMALGNNKGCAYLYRLKHFKNY